jgi:hypothetical protein
MLRRLDRSRWLSKRLAQISNTWARRRGLPIVLGIALVMVGFTFQVVDVYSEARLIELSGVVCVNLGVLIALIGVVMVNPLGK